jgi:hypothetical protein
VLVPALILSSLLAVLLISAIALEIDLYDTDWSWKVHDPPLDPENIDEDFILFKRPFINASEYPIHQRDRIRRFMRDKGWRSFNLREGETLIWRDCTIYTQYSKELEQFGYTIKRIEVREGWFLTNIALEMADEIILTKSTNLTMINVTFPYQVFIRLIDNASLKMINCTNVAVVEVEEYATVWIDGTTLGVLTGTWYSKGGLEIRPPQGYATTIINSSIQYVRLRCQSPIRIIDSKINKLYADEGDVEQIGTTEVTNLMPFSHRNQ